MVTYIESSCTYKEKRQKIFIMEIFSIKSQKLSHLMLELFHLLKNYQMHQKKFLAMFSCRTYKDEFQVFQLRGKGIAGECYNTLIQGGNGLLFFVITKSSNNSKEKKKSIFQELVTSF